ncbi:MFS transporter [Deinococcus hopiensis]|uniref:Predicted arabinose efflux permease, MFS family n=1 Tax=Deinococcus hopiensis KR-140 TaxID=695939 RepID=A0A1W1ULV4_9DEIO|nr:MFS transporter [Deinococcus hopiensis]SMB81704.1 Predicted arabinose efflux permease, MFS family [Deinococcus hopiensis KR-140]
MLSTNPSSPPGLIWPSRSYRLYLAASSISSVGNGMQFIVASWLATELTGDGAASAAVLICSTLPGVLFAPIAGVLADRYDRRKLAAMMDLFRAVVLLGVPLIATLGQLQVGHLYLVSFLTALGDTIYKPTQSALVREIVPSARLLQANTSAMIGIQLGMIVGAGSSGLLMTWLTPPAVMLLNALSFVLSAICTLQMLSLRSGNAKEQDQGNVPPGRQYLWEMRLGWTYLRQNSRLAFPYVMALVLASTAQSMNALLVPFVHQVLRLSPGALGLIDGAWAVGAVLAGFILPLLLQRFSKAVVMVAAPGLLSLTLLLGSRASGLVEAVLAWGLMGLFSRSLILYRTAAQEHTALEYQGRVESTFGVLTSLTFLTLYVLLGSAQAAFGPRVLIVAQGLLIGGAALWAWRALRSGTYGSLVSNDRT